MFKLLTNSTNVFHILLVYFTSLSFQSLSGRLMRLPYLFTLLICSIIR